MMVSNRQIIAGVVFASHFATFTNGNLIPAEPEGYIDCPLCANETHRIFTYGTFLADNGVITCREAFDKEIRLPPENCTAWQSRGSDVCRCAADAPAKNDCKLCDDDSSLPQGALAAIPGTFCAQLQVDASRDYTDRCPVWQQTMGKYCGCNNTYDASVCRICGEGFSFDPAKVVDGIENGTTVSCGEIEFSANLASSGDLGCKEYQFIFERQCCKQIPNQLEDISGGIGVSSAIDAAVVSAAAFVIAFSIFT